IGLDLVVVSLLSLAAFLILTWKQTLKVVLDHTSLASKPGYVITSILVGVIALSLHTLLIVAWTAPSWTPKLVAINRVLVWLFLLSVFAELPFRKRKPYRHWLAKMGQFKKAIS